MGFGQAMIVVFGWTGLGLLLALVGLEVRDPLSRQARRLSRPR
jgi:hypothetical protein